MEKFLNSEAGVIVENILTIIEDNAAYLSKIDGAIGDGDHGVNMKKGMKLYREQLDGKKVDLFTSLQTLGQVLMVEIGGSMGPLYGLFFKRMAKMCKDRTEIDATTFKEMILSALTGIQDIGGAKVGDKTLIDTLVPAVEGFSQAVREGKSFKQALEAMSKEAERGRDSTKDLVAKIGRASRLGERSKGVLDAGAISCCLILQSIGATSISLLDNKS